MVHTNGCCCGPEKIGPLIGWLTSVTDTGSGAAATTAVSSHAQRVAAVVQTVDETNERARARHDVERVRDVDAVERDLDLVQRDRLRHVDLDERVAAADLIRAARQHGDDAAFRELRAPLSRSEQ